MKDFEKELIGYFTGAGIPAVFQSRVSRVWVRCWTLAHRDGPPTPTRGCGYSTGFHSESSFFFNTYFG